MRWKTSVRVGGGLPGSGAGVGRLLSAARPCDGRASPRGEAQLEQAGAQLTPEKRHGLAAVILNIDRMGKSGPEGFGSTIICTQHIFRAASRSLFSTSPSPSYSIPTIHMNASNGLVIGLSRQGTSREVGPMEAKLP
jgi:hypothetical protein